MNLTNQRHLTVTNVNQSRQYNQITILKWCARGAPVQEKR